MEIKLYDNDLTTPSFVEELTHKVQGLSFSTRLHGGFHTCSFKLKADLPEAWEWLTQRIFYRLVITDGSKTLWEGRLEDIGLSAGVAEATAYGYYTNLSDYPYRTAYNAVASVVIKAILTAACTQISSDQSNIAATNVTITSAADASYLDIYPQELVEKLLAFSDTGKSKWYFGIWKDRIPYLKARSVTSLDWKVNLRDFKQFSLKYRAGELWNSCYAVYDAAGIARTADANDTDSQTKYNLTRQYVIPALGTVAAAAAQGARDGWLEDHKEIWPKLTSMVLGDTVYDSSGVKYPSSWVRAGEVLRVAALVPASVDAGSVTRDALRTYYIIETEYDIDRAELRVVPDTESTGLDTLLATKI